LFIDFEQRDIICKFIAARAEIIWDGPEVRAFAGARRLVRYHLQEVIRGIIVRLRGAAPGERNPMASQGRLSPAETTSAQKCSCDKKLSMVSLLWLRGSAQSPRMNPCRRRDRVKHFQDYAVGTNEIKVGIGGKVYIQ
jgi:hypothetical protein